MNDKIVSFEDYRKRKLGDNYKREFKLFLEQNLLLFH